MVDYLVNVCRSLIGRVGTRQTQDGQPAQAVQLLQLAVSQTGDEDLNKAQNRPTGRYVEIAVEESERRVYPAPKFYGSCQVVSGTFVHRYKETGALYCVGFYSGPDGVLKSHAWIKHHGIYLDLTPQPFISVSSMQYLLVHEMTWEELYEKTRQLGYDLKVLGIPPLINSIGEYYCLEPDAEATFAQLGAADELLSED